MTNRLADHIAMVDADLAVISAIRQRSERIILAAEASQAELKSWAEGRREEWEVEKREGEWNELDNIIKLHKPIVEHLRPTLSDYQWDSIQSTRNIIAKRVEGGESS